MCVSCCMDNSSSIDVNGAVLVYVVGIRAYIHHLIESTSSAVILTILKLQTGQTAPTTL